MKSNPFLYSNVIRTLKHLYLHLKIHLHARCKLIKLYCSEFIQCK